MADSEKKKEISSAAGLFSHSFGGNLSFDNVPRIFTPVPLPVSSHQPVHNSVANSVSVHQETLILPFLSNANQKQAFQSPISTPHILETAAPPPGLDISALLNSQVQTSQHLHSSGLSTLTHPSGLQSLSPSGPRPSALIKPQTIIPPPGVQMSSSLKHPIVSSSLLPDTSGSLLSDLSPSKLPNSNNAFSSTTVTTDSQSMSSHLFGVKQTSSDTKPIVNQNSSNPINKNNSDPITIESTGSISYFSPVVPHWFYFNKSWIPFSFYDSKNLEEAFLQQIPNKIVTTDGGRFDVDISTLHRIAIYWSEAKCEVRRCSWFYKEESQLIPYNTHISNVLEMEYAKMIRNGIYNVRVDIAPNVFVLFHNPNVLVQYVSDVEHVDWTGADAKVRPKVVQRGVGELQETIQQGETKEVDHLVFVVHGIGPVADLKMRSIVECVEDFRRISLDLTLTHGFTNNGNAARRVEFIPVQWHSCLRNDLHGVDSQLKKLSLPSISKLRNFTNETLTDILFYTSPMYCQTICDTIINEMNRLYALFLSRTPTFNGKICVAGHSLGSCILFDILANQNFDSLPVNHLPDEDFEVQSQVRSIVPLITQYTGKKFRSVNEILTHLNLLHLESIFIKEQMDTETLLLCTDSDLKDLGIQFGPRKKLMLYLKDMTNDHQETSTTKSEAIQMLNRGTQTPVSTNKNNKKSLQMAYHKGTAGTGQPLVQYSKLEFITDSLFALGSPLGLFLTCRGVTSIGQNYKLPNCNHFLNIFHPFDPVVYRLEPLINENIDLPPVLIPHHKGRKRIHLEIKENLARVGVNLKTGLLDAVSRTWSSINEFARAHTSQYQQQQQQSQMVSQDDLSSAVHESHEDDEQLKREKTFNFGLINGGKRVDYVLQERPLEMLNEYLFALSSHACYWTSEDTALLLLNHIYSK
ncbi:SEC23-interacting protein [Hydra vulgaris]|uniref:SEC23-interacting protein n=1 Tax=Hydra vulgaris TaxID=6087 RepID=UPI001F5FD581|nr:SEC23-interacting protein [Hydra vulgaris]